METLASHGFVVVAVDHIGNSQSPSPLPKDPQQAAADRVPDLSFAIDTMLEDAQDRLGFWYRAIDPFRIGVTGHGFGGSAAMGIAAGSFGEAPADPRVKVILPVAGDMEVFSDFALSLVPVPLLLLGASLDSTVPIAGNARAFDLNQALQPVWNVVIKGATHSHFADVCAIADGLFALGLEPADWPGIGAGDLVEPWLSTCTAGAFPIAEAQRLQSLYTVAFFKLNLAGDGRYMRFLTPRYGEMNEPAIALERKAMAAWVAEYKVW
jgi:dienelactone hydrolase